jgi:hypothetical protein
MAQNDGNSSDSLAQDTGGTVVLAAGSEESTRIGTFG